MVATAMHWWVPKIHETKGSKTLAGERFEHVYIYKYILNIYLFIHVNIYICIYVYIYIKHYFNIYKYI